MISTLYISKALEGASLNTNIIRKKKTSGINMVDVEIEKEGRTEVFCISTSPYIKHKVFIETKKKKTEFSREELFEIEQKIMEGILTTPTNIFPNLLNPIYFDSSNFFNLNQEAICTTDIQEVFQKEILGDLESEAAGDLTKDKQSMFGFAYPRCDFEDSLNELFDSSELVCEINQEEGKNVIHFYSFKDTWVEEQASLKKIEASLKEVGINGEICFALAG